MMINFGIIGVVGLMIAYLLLITRWSKYFIIVDIIASVFFLIHSCMIKDIAFIVMNIFMMVVLSIKQYRGGIK